MLKHKRNTDNTIEINGRNIYNSDVSVSSTPLEMEASRNYEANFELNSNPLSFQGEVTISKITDDKTYIFEQGIASDVWYITHNLDKYPSVTVVDTAGTQFYVEVKYIDKSNIVLYMNGATKGKAYLN